MANIPNGRVYGEKVANSYELCPSTALRVTDYYILYRYKGIRKISFSNQIIVMNCNFIFFDNCLGDAQGFQCVIPVNNQSMLGVFFFGIAMEIKQFI